jgi:NAD(P)H-hydrate repair Nnr-like enzyme with NAD(P)H-hydrate dehydratase domain
MVTVVHPYGRLADALAAGDAAGGRVVALPDGSVDTYYRVFEGRRRAVESRAVFGDRIAGRRASSFQVTEDSREPGGQSVNAALQVGALGGDVTLYGHLDDPVFDGLPVETHSMGAPAAVSVFEFADGELMLSEESPDLLSWTVADLRAAPGATDALAAADAVCVGNWVSLPGMDSLLAALGDLVEGATVVFDPGDLTGCDAAVLTDLAASLRRLADAVPVVASVNGGEADALADVLDAPGETLPDRLDAVRDAASLAAAVVHDRDRALVADDRGVRAVPNLTVERALRRTGGGDRFTGALATGLAAGLDRDLSVALGNACASHYVATAETGDAGDVATYVRESA